MLLFVQQHGKKWATLVKILNNTRNEHSVKNKFSSIIKKHKRLHKGQGEQEMYEAIISRICSKRPTTASNWRRTTSPTHLAPTPLPPDNAVLHQTAP
jgi:hypothetical protein